jgi:hypothetical protein
MLDILSARPRTTVYPSHLTLETPSPTSLTTTAGDFLAIPAMSAPSECVFSVGSDVVTKKRNRLTGDSVRMIMCLEDWGIVTDEDIEEDETPPGSKLLK